MESTERIKLAFERNARAVSPRPVMGQGTAVTRVRLRDGLTCDIEDGRWKLTADLGEKSGGYDRGPNPGILGRAALGSCLAVGYAMWAARRGVTLSRLEVEIQADYDARGELGVAEVSPGYHQVRCIVTVESPSPESAVRAVIEEAEAHSPYYEIFRQPVDVQRELRVTAPVG